MVNLALEKRVLARTATKNCHKSADPEQLLVGKAGEDLQVHARMQSPMQSLLKKTLVAELHFSHRSLL